MGGLGTRVKRAINKISQNRGQALILTYMTIVFFALLSPSLFGKIISERWLLERQRLEKEAFYLAEGGAEDAISQFIAAVANFQVPEGDVALYPSTGAITTTYSSSAAFPAGAEVTSVITEAEDDVREITDPDGTKVGVKAYIVTSECQHPTNSSIKVKLNQAFILRLIYTFQHAVFYGPDLELEPAPTMTLTGRIHCNSDISIDCYDWGATFKIDSQYLRSAGNIFHGRELDRRHGQGSVQIKKAGTGTYVKMNPGAPGLNVPPYYDSESWPEAEGSWTTGALTRWGGTVQDSAHGVTSLVVPNVASIETTGHYSQAATLYVYNDTVYTGLPVALGGTGTPLAEGSGVDDLPPGTITTTDEFKNNREGKFVSMTNIDMQKLAGYVDDADKADGVPSHTSRLPSNGLIYATRDETVGEGQQPGIRLIKGSEIERTKGLTVVSNDPVYIQGDYNTDEKKPAAIICDSLNILSNAWSDDENSEKFLDTYRIASATTVNAAFIAGIEETTSSPKSHGGGFQNFPRLHETWDNKNLYITGSFVALGESQVATGHYAWGPPQYKPPNRYFQWDSSFVPGALPPFTPWAVEAQRSGWWKE